MIDSASEQKARTPSRAVRILHAHSGNLYGGVEVALASVARLGPTRGIVADFALCFDARCAREIRASGRPLHILGPVRTRYPWQGARARRKLEGVLDATAYDAVVLQNPWGLANFARTVRSRGVPLIFHLHGTFERETDTALIDRLARRWPPDLVICNSEYSASTLDRFFPGVPRTVVAHPFEMRSTASDARQSVRAGLGLTDEIVILQASRLDSWKGHRLHLAALALVKSSRRWVSLIAGGPQRPDEGAAFEGLVSYARELGIADRVRFLGQRNDVPELMAAADVFCQPNTGPEPFGLVFIEALSAGLPIVTTAMGGALEIVQPGCGYLVPPRPEDVARALTTLIDDDALRASMCEPAKRRAAEVCDPDQQMARMRDAIASATLRARSR